MTYSISEEYFTKFKFDQFASINPTARSARIAVAMIGFLATWWVGGIAGWALARIAASRHPDSAIPLRMIISGFGTMLSIVAIGGVVGFVVGRFYIPQSWESWAQGMGVEDFRAFSDVGMIHNFGYLGAFVGLVVAGIQVCRKRLYDEA